ncbi:YggS family pyridoxal phosphate-dependent enzyme [Maricaulis sp.]|uniref:YggS family pyridoxal phosphate-dependent enzyme n=1 Tax=Maricaulis sp. TaxID=1486257 RepID=UPI0026070E59|nr:YggS family pyridoxal phosphate-dependent enzyme [Maricaulis sp.]
MTASSDIARRRAALMDTIGDIARQAGRKPSDITLVAVSKRQSDARIDAALTAGQRVFGENRVQEAQARWQDRRGHWPDLELRLIGPLQTNKAAEAVALFDVIETLDRDKLARALRKEMDAQGRTPRLFVQVNTGEEEQKSGVLPAQTAGFVARMREQYGFDIDGLMCIPPVEEPAGLHFALLAKLAAETGLARLSMGMSADFGTAVSLGATSVRVGTALFGSREN